MKKAQITIFIIVGVVLLLLSVFIFTLPTKELERPSPPGDDNEPVKNYIESCLETASTNALLRIGLQGGYIEPIYYDNFFTVKRSYLYKDKIPLIPTVEMMEKELSNFIKNRIENCTNLSMPGFQITFPTEFEVTTKIHNESVAFNLDYPIILESEDEKINIIDPYYLLLDIRLGYLREITEHFILQSFEGYLDYSYLNDQDINFSIYGYLPNVAEITLIDAKSKLKTEPYIFSFLKEHETNTFDTVAPRFKERIITLTAEHGKFFKYNLETEYPDNDLVFYTDTSLFVLSESGELIYLPEKSQIGTHYIKLQVENEFKEKDMAIIEMIVI